MTLAADISRADGCFAAIAEARVGSAHVSRAGSRRMAANWRLGLGCIMLVLFALIAGCSSGVLAPVETRDGYGPAPRGYYRVVRGDTLTAIARRTGHSVSTLAAWNDLGPPYQIHAGSLLRVAPKRLHARPAPLASARDRIAKPSAARSDEKPRTASSSSSTARPTASSSPAQAASGKVSAGGVTWQWPVNGAVEQSYRAGDRSRQGIRIATSPGAKIGAAAKGSVVYSGSGLKGYGNLVIVKHNDHFLSAYGFNRQLLVKQGDTVSAGQVIAEAGQAPNGKYLLHFEIRRDGATVDPLGYLPKR
ncbi:Murein hydrolase activator NlpD precursor [Thiorhodovibrio winogradskyi]|uniref:Murein hydrolase activator NlpD n=1 Tax=Thiorhodovibrio winogradskyi TaxID=77007 RepID=A0ABZ0S7Q8_9GAMM|nr:peptidoglycan DD-metalloendopeptidase family protein [Thiorhodovibrio winogradskyi]